MATSIAETLWNGILTFLNSFARARVPPLGQADDDGEKNPLVLAGLTFVVLLVLLARSIQAGGGFSLSVPATLAGVALVALVVVGLLAYIFYPAPDPKTQSLRGSVFVMVYLILSIIVYILVDVLGLFMFGRAPSNFIVVDLLGVDSDRLGYFLIALFYSLVSWGLLIIRSVRQFPNISWLDTVWTLQFPAFVLINAGLFYVVVLTHV